MIKVHVLRRRPARAIFQMAVWVMFLLLLLPPLHLLAPGGGCPTGPNGPSCHGACGDERSVSSAGRLHSPIDCPLCLDLLHAAATFVPDVRGEADLPPAPARLDVSYGHAPVCPLPATWAPRAPPSFLG